MNELISVIVPVYNVAPYLERCVESICRQIYRNLEIILVDDGSTDSSGKLCDRLAESDERVKVIHKKNGGLSSARNRGLDCAVGTYIGFVDSDDYIDLSMYEILYQKLKQYNAGVAICSRYYESEDGKRETRFPITGKDRVMNAEEAIEEMNFLRSFDMAAYDKLYRKEVFADIRFPEGKLSEDYFIMFRVFQQAGCICFTPQPLYFYIQREGSISRNQKINYDYIEAAYEQMINVEKIFPRLEGCMHSAYAFANMTVYNFHLKSGMPCSAEQRDTLRKNVLGNMNYIRKSRALPWRRKMQSELFIRSFALYGLFFRIYKRFRKY